jgi:transcription-repair coupling factor (superfamily II helicase)
MDRLVCGDVGFGKTEVALRASLRTVLEGGQVLVLVPTTVLCYQHYRTFKDRLERHGVRVAQVNRFVSAEDTKRATEGLQNGAVDVLIGTHRILSKDVKPKRLGLLVVDEEQRFGVGHKEKLKELRAGAHCLTLTATPIPRTLHMSMVGLRDISIIATPPQDRVSVKTYISRFDETLIKEAIEQEVRRGGQVFFVHNRVEDIVEMQNFLKSLIPGLEVRVGHGQMREHQLEKVIVDFLEQKFPVLLCTTIIESGIDMPNVNTLIVDRADRFGLAQLYQLRGRVGRSNLQAYAYFLTPAEDRLSDDGKKRLDVLAAHQELGAGFQIASHDLELRGAGNLLGGEQSGHAAAVGLELYTELLEAAIQELRGKPVQERVDTEIKIPVSALIPTEYVPVETQRLHLYKSLFAADTEDDLASLRQDVADRYGPLPFELSRLFKVARLKQLLRKLGAQRLTVGKGLFEVRFAPLAEKQIDALIKAAAHRPEHYKLAPDAKLLLFLDCPSQPNAKQQDDMLQALIGLVDPLVAAVC